MISSARPPPSSLPRPDTGSPRSDDRASAFAWHRRVGTRVLPPVQERPTGLREGHLQGRQLGGRAGEAHCRDRLASSRNKKQKKVATSVS